MIAQHNNLKGNAYKAARCLPASYRHHRYIVLLRVKAIAPRRRRLIETAMTTPAPLIPIPTIPLHLVPPEPTEVNPEDLEHIFSSQNQGMHPAFLRDQLVRTSANFIAGLHAVKMDSQIFSAPYPERVHVAFGSQLPFAICPTHILAVYDDNTGPNTSTSVNQSRPRVTVFPVHELILRVNCTNLPTLLRSAGATSAGITAAGVTLPVARLRVWSASTFHILYHFLYNKDTRVLRAALRPPSTEASAHENAWKRAIVVHGVYMNAMSMGVINEQVGRERKSIYQVIEEEWADINMILRYTPAA